MGAYFLDWQVSGEIIKFSAKNVTEFAVGQRITCNDTNMYRFACETL